MVMCNGGRGRKCRRAVACAPHVSVWAGPASTAAVQLPPPAPKGTCVHVELLD